MNFTINEQGLMIFTRSSDHTDESPRNKNLAELAEQGNRAIDRFNRSQVQITEDELSALQDLLIEGLCRINDIRMRLNDE